MACVEKAERYQRVFLPDDFLQSNHAVFGKSGLLGTDGCLERFDIWYHPPRRRQPAPGKQTPGNEAHVEIVVFDLLVGRTLTGHEGLVHGGIISLLFDEAIGWAYQCFAHESKCRWEDESRRRRHERNQTIQWKDLDATPPAVTANLNVTYKQPLPAGQRCLLRVYHLQSEGKKHHFEASLESKTAGTEDEILNANAIVYAEATCLMVVVVDDKLRSRI